jgi:predicted HAD superfamily hydrolase
MISYRKSRLFSKKEKKPLDSFMPHKISINGLFALTRYQKSTENQLKRKELRPKSSSQP